MVDTRLATTNQRAGLHKWGIKTLPDNLTFQQASDWMDNLSHLTPDDRRLFIAQLNGEVTAPKAPPKPEGDYVVDALQRARKAFEAVFPELATQEIAPLALSLAQSVLKDVRSEKINGNGRER